MSTWFITGCSAGLGRALAEAVLERGESAAITARDAGRLEDLAKALSRRVIRPTCGGCSRPTSSVPSR